RGRVRDAPPRARRGGPVTTSITTTDRREGRILGLVNRPFVRAAGAAAAFPLVVLFFMYFFDEFDTAAFGVLAPRIKHAFHLSNQGFVSLQVANLVVLLLLSIPLGYYADRINRVRIVWISAIIAGAFSF